MLGTSTSHQPGGKPMTSTSDPTTDVPAVSMTNTKKELLEAYQKARAVIEQQGEALLQAEEARARAEEQVAVATADAQTREDPVRRLHELRADVGRKFSELAEQLEAEVETYERVKKAAELKQAELRQLYEIESAASDLAALIEAQRARKEEFEGEMARRKDELQAELGKRKEELETEIAATRAAWDEEKKRQQAAAAEAKAELEKARTRDEEEYSYALEREREQRRNALEDELAALGKEIADRRNAFEQETSAKEAELQQRENAVKAAEEELSQLREKVEAFPAERDIAVRAAVDETTKRLETAFESKEALFKAQFEGEKNVLCSKIESLEAQNAALRAQIAELTTKQDKAYEKIQDIANRAVDAARREVVTVPVRAPAEDHDR